MFRLVNACALLLLASELRTSSGGIAEIRAAAKETNKRRMEKQNNFHNTGGNQQHDHKGHPGHAGEHMNEMPIETLLEYHELHHHESGTLPLKHRLPPGQHDLPEHLKPRKDQKGDHHNPPDLRDHTIEGDIHDFGIDVHTGRKRIKKRDIREHIWDKHDPDHPHAHYRSSKKLRKRKFRDHPLRKYDWMEEKSRALSHEHAEELRKGNVPKAEELAHQKRDLDKELRHLEMMHHGMTEDEYQEFKGWQNELEQLNKVDSHGLEKEEKVQHRDRMIELSRQIRSTKDHYSFVPQPHVRPHATLEDNIKMHKMWEAIHKTDDKTERAKLKNEFEELKERLRFEEKHRVYDQDDVDTIKALRQQLETIDKDDYIERENIRTAIQEIYVRYEKEKAEKHGHVIADFAHDEAKAHKDLEFTEDGPKGRQDEYMDDPEIKELHEELHHLESHQWEEKKRIDNRLKNRMHELQHDGQMHHNHIKGHLDAAVNLTKHHEENHGHDPPREPEAPPDRHAKPIIVM